MREAKFATTKAISDIKRSRARILALAVKREAEEDWGRERWR
jgi:hypothetical protein